MVTPESTAESGVNKEDTEEILYFLSKNAESVTGQVIGVNGGCST